MIKAHRADAVVGDGGTLVLHGVPLSAGDKVEVIVLAAEAPPERPTIDDVRQRLAGSVLRYDDPTEPVGVDDWEALK